MQDVRQKDEAYTSNQPYAKMMLEFIRIFGLEELKDVMDVAITESEEPLRNVA